MSRRATGVTFCCISCVLFSITYICAAIYASDNDKVISETLFHNALGYVEKTPLQLSKLSLTVGIIYIIIGEIETIVKEYFMKNTNKNEQ